MLEKLPHKNLFYFGNQSLAKWIEQLGGVDGVIGGPPCQAYSFAGRVKDKNGMRDDYRNYLFESFVELVKIYKPKGFIFENVLGILTAKPGGKLITERIIKSFEEIGYSISVNLREDAVFNMAHFGIPQERKRVIIFGVPKTDDKKISEFLPKVKTTTSKVYDYSLGENKEIPTKHLCLPIWYELEEAISDKVVEEIKESTGM